MNVNRGGEMTTSSIAGAGGRTLRVRGTAYPVLLPTLRDPRLHLAAVTLSLHVLGQTAFDFDLSIAQILVSVATCAVLEVGIALWRHRLILWPASALLTGSGVAFILRVPGTEHGDWWSLHGAWIFAGTAAVALLSKYVLRFRGSHVFNPSNIGLVLCFLALGEARAEPLDLWWGPMSVWLALALVIIVAGGFGILSRLHLVGIAAGFWLAFAAAIGVLAASGHAMTARWHVGPIEDWEFWRVLMFSPEVLLFLFFMITDPRTVPAGRRARVVFGVSVALLAALAISPLTTEYDTKVALLVALTVACAARVPIAVLSSRGVAARWRGLARWSNRLPRAAAGATAVVGVASFVGLLVLAGGPARPSAGAATEASAPVPEPTVLASNDVAPIDRLTARRIARDVVADLRVAADALRRRDRDRATDGAGGAWLAGLWQQIRAAEGNAIVVPEYRVERIRLTLKPGGGQGPPVVAAALAGTVELVTYTGVPPAITERRQPARFSRTFELVLEGNRYVIVRAAGPDPTGQTTTGAAPASVTLTDVAASVGLQFRHGAFRFGVSNDPAAMMGGGLCWLDYDDDGWLDLYVTNAYADRDYGEWDARGEFPRNALFHNVGGRFEDVSRGSGADLQLRASGCAAGDFDRDGHTDIYVTTVGYSVPTDGYDALLWGHGDGTFTEGARDAGINTPGWHAAAAIGDVNGDGWPDIAVTGYTDPNGAIPSSSSGFPGNHLGVADRLYLSQGAGESGRPTFRDVAAQVGIERKRVEHGLGAVFTDADGDGRLDLYVANDADPNRLYLNVAASGGVGFRLQERALRQGVADPNAGMGIASADYSRDGLADLFVTNSRGQLHAAFRARAGEAFLDARAEFAPALGTRFTGWGVSWVDLDLDGDLDLALANGAIPITKLAKDAQRIQVLENRKGEFVAARPSPGPRVNGRGLAAADYDNDGDVDLAINSIGGPLVLLENTGARGNWLEVQLERFAPGAVVTAVLPSGKRFVREVHAGSSYLSSEDPRVHFGLGSATEVTEVLVRYPDGSRVRLTDVSANQIVRAR